MTTKECHYWHKETESIFLPLTSDISELNACLDTYDLEWCYECKAGVEPESCMDYQGLVNQCPFCGTLTTLQYEAPLTSTQHRAMVLYHLGGMDAWIINEGKRVHGRTIKSLIRQGYFNEQGATRKGRVYCEIHGEDAY